MKFSAESYETLEKKFAPRTLHTRTAAQRFEEAGEETKLNGSQKSPDFGELVKGDHPTTHQRKIVQDIPGLWPLYGKALRARSA